MINYLISNAMDILLIVLGLYSIVNFKNVAKKTIDQRRVINRFLRINFRYDDLMVKHTGFMFIFIGIVFVLIGLNSLFTRLF